MNSSSILVKILAAATLLAGVGVTSEARADWPMYNHDASGSRYASEEHHLGP
jgi:hypothetical protein